MSYSKAIVKSVYSGDSLILRGRQVGNSPPAERQFNLNYIVSPRLANLKKDTLDEPFGLESKEYLRRLVVGKEVSFKVEYTTTSGREYGSVFLNKEDISELLIKGGWCSLKEDNKINTEEEEVRTKLENLSLLQQKAKEEGKGIWNTNVKPSKLTSTFPEELREFLNLYKGQKLPGFIEQVRDGSTFKTLVKLPSKVDEKDQYQIILLSLSGVKAPILKKNIPNVEDVIEPFAEESKYFVESRLLQKDIYIILEGMNNNNLCGTIVHPNGNIAEALVSSGLAKVVDWSITMVTGGPTKLRQAEKIAKEKKLKLWFNHIKKDVNVNIKETKFEATVIGIINGDTLQLRNKNNDQDIKVQLSSIRSPRSKEPKEGYYANQAKEYLRKTLIGKQVKVQIDYIKPASDGYDERQCATILFNNNNVGKSLIDKGLAFAFRHRKDDDNRSPSYDDFMMSEENAKEKEIGVHSNKDTPTLRFTDASESLAKAKQFLSFFQRSGKVSAVVEHISNASRFKLFVPSQNCKLTFILSGVKVPKVGRTPSEPSDPFGLEAFKYMTNIAMQRDVEIEVEGTDKNGGFIGSLFINSKDNAAVKLLELGYGTIFGFSADQSNYSNQLYQAESLAKNKKVNIWTTINESEDNNNGDDEVKDVKAEPVRVVISDIVDASKFSIQIVSNEIQQLEQLMSEFSIHHNKALTSTQTFTPKSGMLCSAKFTSDDQWYRARIRKISNNKAEVVYVDYGNSETLPLTRLRPIDAKFTKLQPQALDAKLAYLKIPSLNQDYGDEAFFKFRDLVEGKQFIATIETRHQNIAYLILYQDKTNSITNSVNTELLKSGLAIIHKENKLVGSLKFRQSHLKFLTKIQEQVKTNRVGMWEFGEVASDEEEE